jgi:hypothetical protein
MTWSGEVACFIVKFVSFCKTDILPPEHLELGQPKLNVRHIMVDVIDSDCYRQEMSQVDKEVSCLRSNILSSQRSALRSTMQ